MINSARVDLAVDRWTALSRTIDIAGLNIVSAHAQVRLYPDAAGVPLVDLPLVTDGTDGVRILSVDTSGVVPVSHLRLQLAAPTLAALPEAAEAGNNVDLAWDILVNESGGQPFKLLFGTFTIVAGVTRNG